jgi:hypothetical protein
MIVRLEYFLPGERSKIFYSDFTNSSKSSTFDVSFFKMRKGSISFDSLFKLFLQFQVFHNISFCC